MNFLAVPIVEGLLLLISAVAGVISLARLRELKEKHADRIFGISEIVYVTAMVLYVSAHLSA